ncbi:glycosyltransferase [bacterium]|jgi:glycosyltransferase involved in cell wall biosynthesis|nr:glycosyltransferase [bacterium]MBT4495527.1 glycosyltransferase [bacterium]MBT4764185.1 glycosyltransferase [bacterium]MBT5401557.1 glycosyltransferase [bacterium]MBT5942484.1 glycosyltransferase [bacterium]
MSSINTICYFGDFDPNYSRNRVLIKGFKENNIEVLFVNAKSIKELINKHKDVENKYDQLIVGYSDNQFMVPIAKLISNKPIIWDAFYSLYDSWVNDKKLVSRNSFKSKYYWLLDWLSIKLANKVLLDTNEHIKYFKTTFGGNKYIKVLVGSDESVFLPKVKEQSNSFVIHFHGKYIPLQGIEYIIEAAKALEEYKDIKFNLVGSGQEHDKIIKLASKLDVNNINFISKQSYSDLTKYISQSDICLGIFGKGQKTTRVIPNKVYEAIAMQKAVITANTPAINELFKDKENILLCNQADSKDLVEKILLLRNDSKLRGDIADNGYKLFKEKCLSKIIVNKLINEL